MPSFDEGCGGKYEIRKRRKLDYANTIKTIESSRI